MKKPRRSKVGLVIEHLEGISRTAIKRYPDIITEFVRGRSGVYALYKDKEPKITTTKRIGEVAAAFASARGPEAASLTPSGKPGRR